MLILWCLAVFLVGKVFSTRNVLYVSLRGYAFVSRTNEISAIEGSYYLKLRTTNVYETSVIASKLSGTCPEDNLVETSFLEFEMSDLQHHFFRAIEATMGDGIKTFSASSGFTELENGMMIDSAETDEKIECLDDEECLREVKELIDLRNDDGSFENDGKKVPVVIQMYLNQLKSLQVVGGTDSEEYFQVLAVKDIGINQLLSRIQERVNKYAEEWMVIVTSGECSVEETNSLPVKTNVVSVQFFGGELSPARQIIQAIGSSCSLAEIQGKECILSISRMPFVVSNYLRIDKNELLDYWTEDCNFVPHLSLSIYSVIVTLFCLGLFSSTIIVVIVLVYVCVDFYKLMKKPPNLRFRDKIKRLEANNLKLRELYYNQDSTVQKFLTSKNDTKLKEMLTLEQKHISLLEVLQIQKEQLKELQTENDHINSRLDETRTALKNKDKITDSFLNIMDDVEQRAKKTEENFGIAQETMKRMKSNEKTQTREYHNELLKRNEEVMKMKDKVALLEKGAFDNYFQLKCEELVDRNALLEKALIKKEDVLSDMKQMLAKKEDSILVFERKLGAKRVLLKKKRSKILKLKRANLELKFEYDNINTKNTNYLKEMTKLRVLRIDYRNLKKKNGDISHILKLKEGRVQDLESLVARQKKVFSSSIEDYKKYIRNLEDGVIKDSGKSTENLKKLMHEKDERIKNFEKNVMKMTEGHNALQSSVRKLEMEMVQKDKKIIALQRSFTEKEELELTLIEKEKRLHLSEEGVKKLKLQIEKLTLELKKEKEDNELENTEITIEKGGNTLNNSPEEEEDYEQAFKQFAKNLRP